MPLRIAGVSRAMAFPDLDGLTWELTARFASGLPSAEKDHVQTLDRAAPSLTRRGGHGGAC
jgi:hypothetical protein